LAPNGVTKKEEQNMSIKAIFPAGVDAIRVHGLHQWDYGRQLEIYAEDMPAMVEVHFACIDMKEAVVRACAVVNGVATATIPNSCLEQTAPICAWVYLIDGTKGKTVLTAVLHVTPRIKPASAPTIPDDVSDKYTELITGVNEQIGHLKNGTTVVKLAEEAKVAHVPTPAPLVDPQLPGAGWYYLNIIETDMTNLGGDSSAGPFYWDGVRGLNVPLHGGAVLGVTTGGHLQLTDKAGYQMANSDFIFYLSRVWEEAESGEPEDPSVVNFTIDGEPYTAPEGTTWQDLINDGFAHQGEVLGTDPDGNVSDVNWNWNVRDEGGNPVRPENEIHDGDIYTFMN
jgi:hypothetical protein